MASNRERSFTSHGLFPKYIPDGLGNDRFMMNDTIESGLMKSYQIEVAGHVDLSWAEWFQAVTLAHLPRGSTSFTIETPDQSALLGLLLRLHSLGIQLINLRSVTCEMLSEEQIQGD